MSLYRGASLARAASSSMAMLAGMYLCHVLGNFGAAFGALLLLAALLWRFQLRERSRSKSRAQAHLLYLESLLHKARTHGSVGHCYACHRPMRADSKRCVYCGGRRLDGPLR